MLSKSSRWPRQLPQEMGKKPLRLHRLRRFISLHYLPQVPPVSGSGHPTRAPGNGSARKLVHNASIMRGSSFPTGCQCRHSSAVSGSLPSWPQVRNVLLGIRFQSPRTQSHDHPCHHRSNNGTDSKSLLRLHCPQKIGVRNSESTTLTAATLRLKRPRKTNLDRHHHLRMKHRSMHLVIFEPFSRLTFLQPCHLGSLGISHHGTTGGMTKVSISTTLMKSCNTQKL